MGIFSAIQRYFRLRGISRRLASGPDVITLDDLVNGDLDQERNSAEEELFSLIEADDSLRRIMRAHGACRETLRDAYHLLLGAGCGQWVKGHWLAASALAFSGTLDYVLTSVDIENGHVPGKVIVRLVEVFK